MDGFLESVAVGLVQAQRLEQKFDSCDLTDDEIIALWNAPAGSVEFPLSDAFFKRSEELMDKGLIKRPYRHNQR